MAASRPHTRIRWLLAAVAVAIVAGLGRLDLKHRISSDVLDLIPAGERSPELALVRSMASEKQARVVLLALDLPERSPRRKEAGTALAAALRASPAFAEATLMGDGAAREALGRALFSQRFDLLLPGWIEARRRDYLASGSREPWPDWLAEHTARSLESFLAQPEALAFQDLIASDPLLLLPGLVAAFQGLQEPAATETGPVLVWALARASPLREEGQEPVFRAVEDALAAARAIEPAASLRWSSIARFAAESRHRIEHELSLLNLVSLAAVLAVGALCLRRMLKSIHLAAVILGGLGGAWLVTLYAFERVHVLVFVVGSLLGGVAVDYGFYLYLQPPANEGESYAGKVRRLLKPLLASALTTVLGFSLLLFSELPLIRQLGVFVSAGLLCALAVALLWFAQVTPPFMETRPLVGRRLRPTVACRRIAQGLLAAAALVAVTGPWRLHWRDDIRELEISAPLLRAEAAGVQALFGERADRTIYLTQGADPAAARAALDRFRAWHDARHPDSRAASLGLAVPSREDYASLQQQLPALGELGPRLADALARHGFEAGAFAAFTSAWDDWRIRPHPDYDDMVRRLAGSLQGPLALLCSTTPGTSWFASIALHPPEAEAPPPETATVSVNQLQNLNRLFGRYRTSALHLSALGLGLVGLSVFALYGLRQGPRIFAVPAGACLFAFGVLGYAGQPLNLFHLLGAFLGVCLSHNYAIFSAENARRHEEPPPSIRLSALTTATSFGVLAFSHIPVVAALGTTVMLIVLAALAIVELEPLALGAAPQPPGPSLPAP